MRILLVTRFIDRPEAFVIENLLEAGFEIKIVCDPHTRHYQQFAERGAIAAAMQLNSRVSPRAIRTLRQILRSSEFDIVHAVDSRGLANVIWAAYGLPARIIAYRGTVGGITWLDPGCWMAHLHPKVRRIVCVSEAVRQELIRVGLPAARMVTIHKGHDPAWYMEGERSDLSEFGIPPGAFTVGCAANMRPLKGAHVLVQAIHHIPDTAVHLLLAGEVRDNRIEELARSGPASARIHLAGFRSDAARLMGSTDLFVMPSLRREGLPRALLEAMGQGVPAVVTQVGGMPEVVRDGVEGLIVAPGDAAALAAAIGRLRSDEALRRACAAQARARVEGAFNVRHTLERVKALYAEVAQL